MVTAQELFASYQLSAISYQRSAISININISIRYSVTP